MLNKEMNKIALSKEQREYLKEYEDVMRNAVKNDFVHLTSSEFDKIAVVYNQLFTPLRKSQQTCNTCRLNALKRLGELYFETPSKESNKVGRPKKIKE